MAEPRIEQETRIEARPESVWRAWTDPAGLAAWFVDRASGRAEPGAEMTWHWDAFGLDARVRVLEARAPERLVLELSTPSGDARVLEVDIRGEQGGTRLRVVESGFGPGDPGVEDDASGWRLALGVLRIALERYPGRPRGEVLVLEPAPSDAAPFELYATRSGLDQWLCNGDGVVAGAGMFDGERAAASSQETLWTWPARSGAIELKAFGPADGRQIGVRMSVWGDDGARLGELRPALEAAVARLRARLGAVE